MVDAIPSGAEEAGPPGDFEATRWGMIRRAALPEGADALADFCRSYWYPLYVAARRNGLAPEDAADAVQTLFSRIIENNLLESVEEGLGRLRTWLLRVLLNQINGERRARGAQKRGGGVVHLSLDVEGAESLYLADPSLKDTPEAHYRRGLAASLMDQAVEDLAAAYEAAGRGKLFEVLLPALERGGGGASYEELSRATGIAVGTLRVSVKRLREKFRVALRKRAGVAFGLKDEAAIEAELRELFC